MSNVVEFKIPDEKQLFQMLEVARNCIDSIIPADENSETLKEIASERVSYAIELAGKITGLGGAE